MPPLRRADESTPAVDPSRTRSRRTSSSSFQSRCTTRVRSWNTCTGTRNFDSIQCWHAAIQLSNAARLSWQTNSRHTQSLFGSAINSRTASTDDGWGPNETPSSRRSDCGTGSYESDLRPCYGLDVSLLRPNWTSNNGGGSEYRNSSLDHGLARCEVDAPGNHGCLRNRLNQNRQGLCDYWNRDVRDWHRTVIRPLYH